ncbi:hypothetical protein Tco_0980566 [Tanacetum coccineum]
MDELARLRICERIEYTWVWVASGPERQQVAAAGAAQADQEIPEEDVQADPTPIQAPQARAATPGTRTMPQRMGRLEEEVRGVRLNTAYPGFGIRRIDFLTLLNKNDDSGGVFIFWNSVCGSHAGIQTLS